MNESSPPPGVSKKQWQKTKGRLKRIAAIQRLEALGPIKTSMSILAARGGRPVDGNAVKAIKRVGTGSQVKPKRPK
jgi:hypothetical protein